MKKNKVLSIMLRVILCVVAIFVLFWFSLPALNLRDPAFYRFAFTSVVICFVINLFSSLFGFLSGMKSGNVNVIENLDKNTLKKSKPLKAFLLITVAFILVSALGSVIGAEIFNAKGYNELLPVSDGDFTTDVSELSMSQIPVVDRDSASRLGQRKLGEMSDLVSQFEIMDNYTQINYKDTPYRVTPLTYGDPIKWLGNNAEGIPAYITVNMVTQETALVRLDKGMKYSPSEYFMRRLDRHLRFKYPTKIFDAMSFEIDDNGTPYWVAPTITYRVGLWNGRDIDGAVLVNAVTGESTHYAMSDIPKWVDQVFLSDLVIEQLGYYGKYKSGFWNSMFGQRGVLRATEGYNYIAVGDDVFLYTGVTSVTSDQSNVGFVLINLRTKDTKYYPVPGAEEFSAMGSAEGQVQNLKYKSTFPILLNISDRPTYFMSLKDDAGLVKMYAFVDVEQYQIVGTGNTVNEAKASYSAKIKNEDEQQGNQKPQVEQTITAKITAISSAVVGGNTYYYMTLNGQKNVFVTSITVSGSLPFFVVGDNVTTVSTENDGVNTVSNITKK